MKTDKSQAHGRFRKKTSRDANYLPEHVASGFEDELVDLINRLTPSFGTKGSYLLSEFKSKYLDPDVVSPEERRRNAIEKWLAAERFNSKTNQRLYIGDVDFGWVHSDTLIETTRSFIRKALGPVLYPEFVCGEAHTNGASTSVSRSPTAAVDKLTGQAHVSSTALKHWLQRAKNTRLSDQVIAIDDASVLFTVPKKTDIDRVACKEPSGNQLLQRSLGVHIRRRLRRCGIDLRDQSVNQRLAASALQEGLATIDLSSASDTISRQLVYTLLPADWYDLLDDCRVKSTVIDGVTHELEMFSSMGNGFTFELESLIFWALTRAVCYHSGVKGRISVYGDDIIAPCAISPRLARIFAWFGFKVNPKKSNWTGLFRESCGKHYHNGVDITPFYLREKVRTKTDVIRLLNRLLEWAGRDLGFIVEDEILEFHHKWAQVIPRKLWGGNDIDDINSLVTGHSPRGRILSPPTSRTANQVFGLDVHVCDETACLTHWLMVRPLSGSEPVMAHAPRVGRLRIGDQPPWSERTAWRPWLLLSHDSAPSDTHT